MRRAASRAAWTAGSSKPTRTPIMAITTSNSTSVKALLRRLEYLSDGSSVNETNKLNFSDILELFMETSRRCVALTSPQQHLYPFASGQNGIRSEFGQQLRVVNVELKTNRSVHCSRPLPRVIPTCTEPLQRPSQSRRTPYRLARGRSSDSLPSRSLSAFSSGFPDRSGGQWLNRKKGATITIFLDRKQHTAAGPSRSCLRIENVPEFPVHPVATQRGYLERPQFSALANRVNTVGVWQAIQKVSASF